MGSLTKKCGGTARPARSLMRSERRERFSRIFRGARVREGRAESARRRENLTPARRWLSINRRSAQRLTGSSPNGSAAERSRVTIVSSPADGKRELSGPNAIPGRSAPANYIRAMRPALRLAGEHNSGRHAKASRDFIGNFVRPRKHDYSRLIINRAFFPRRGDL